MRKFVGIVLVKPDGSVLSQHRENKPGILGPDTWCVVGGAMEETDGDLQLVAVRELFEETGYIADTESLMFLTRDTYTTERGVSVERTISGTGTMANSRSILSRGRKSDLFHLLTSAD